MLYSRKMAGGSEHQENKKIHFSRDPHNHHQENHRQGQFHQQDQYHRRTQHGQDHRQDHRRTQHGYERFDEIVDFKREQQDQCQNNDGDGDGDGDGGHELTSDSTQQLVNYLNNLKLARRSSEIMSEGNMLILGIHTPKFHDLPPPPFQIPTHADIMKIHLHVGDHMLLDPKCNVPHRYFSEWQTDEELPSGLVLNSKTGVMSGIVSHFTHDLIHVTIKCKYFGVLFDVVHIHFTIDPQLRIINKN